MSWYHTKKLVIRKDGSFSAILRETPLLFHTNRSGTNRTTIFSRKAMKDVWYVTEDKCFGFKLSSYEFQYDPEDTTSCSNGYIIFIAKSSRQDFVNRMKILSKSDTFLRGIEANADIEERTLNISISELREMQTNTNGVWDLSKLAKQNSTPLSTTFSEDVFDIASQIADLKQEEEEQQQQEKGPAPQQQEPKNEAGEVRKPSDVVLTHHNILLTNDDLERLNEGQFLNDNIIDWYLQLLCEDLSPAIAKKCHLFPATFYPLLKKDLFRTVNRVPRVSKVKLYEKDFIFIPVNADIHWMLFVVCFPSKQERCIMYCDSLGRQPSMDLYEVICKYLIERWRIEHPVAQQEPPNFPIMTAKLPNQQNEHDCGVFLLQYVETLLQQIPTLPAIPICDENWFNLEEIPKKRKKIREQIETLMKSDKLIS
jgi:Ulp1 family protease